MKSRDCRDAGAVAFPVCGSLVIALCHNTNKSHPPVDKHIVGMHTSLKSPRYRQLIFILARNNDGASETDMTELRPVDCTAGWELINTWCRHCANRIWGDP